MKNSSINNIMTGSEVYHRKIGYTCNICKDDRLPENIFEVREINSMLNKFKLNDSDVSQLITKCNCIKNSPKAHKLCVLLNIIYNFELKCPECNTEYNISVKKYNLPSQKVINIISLIFVLLINIIIYGVCAFLIIFPLIIKKDFSEGEGKKAFFVSFCFFATILFLINTYLTYITFLRFLIKNPKDVNSYAIDIKDINEQNKNKTDKHYALLYKFYRSFYNTQIRYLVSKKHKNIFISKGYGNFNKELQEMIIKNNIECEKEMLENNNGGNQILGLKINKLNKHIDNENNINNIKEKSNGNIDNISEEDDENKNKENKIINRISSNNNINSNLNLSSKKNKDLLNNIKNYNKSDNLPKEKKSIDIISKSSEISNDTQKQKKKKVIIEIINTDKQNNILKNLSLKEERKNQDNESNKTKKSDSNTSKKNRNKKNEIESKSSKEKDIKGNHKMFEESKESFKNKNEEKNKIDIESSIKNKLLEEPNIFNDNDDLFVSTPIHNNGK